MTVKGGTNHACAACKYQRRKCAPDCALAPYFPHDQPKMFQNAHRLFGVSNIQKILRPLTPNLKKEATRSIIYESNMRARFPLDIYRQQNQIQTPPELLQLGNLSLISASSSPDYNTLSLFQQQSYDANNTCIVNGDKGASILPIQNEIVNPSWIQQHDFNATNHYNSNGNNSTRVQSHEFFVEQPVSFHQEPDVLESQDYDEMPSFRAIDDKEGYESSSPESSPGDATQTIEHVSENELKNAAACFSLTSVN
ncbi:hypothetical protein MKX01_032368 [Papaver californicum]|nr:hypothetical protein MKX01_032368 [Papaver californicum]